jgi:hypothetical protein
MVFSRYDDMYACLLESGGARKDDGQLLIRWLVMRLLAIWSISCLRVPIDALVAPYSSQGIS